ncbi:hypothetical protein [Dipodfec virus UOA04_Rod_504]|nr:hypothetical protein [Dipodfec virus UOA04_Rod_504]
MNKSVLKKNETQKENDEADILTKQISPTDLEVINAVRELQRLMRLRDIIEVTVNVCGVKIDYIDNLPF